jgi:hypothetical protein
MQTVIPKQTELLPDKETYGKASSMRRLGSCVVKARKTLIILHHAVFS